MSPEDLEILQHMMNGGRPPEFAVRLLEDICKRTGLDWKARHVYLQSRKSGGEVKWQAVLSIDGFRTVGARHPAYAGQEGPFWVINADAQWSDIPPEAKPYAAKVGIRKHLESGGTTTTWGVAKYKDYYAGMMWDKFPSTMVAKCAEMLAWRKTFPETFGGLYGDAELEQAARTAERGHPALALRQMPVIGETSVDKADGEVVAEMSPDELRGEYKTRLESASSRKEVEAIGKEIMAADKAGRIEKLDVLQLHTLYNKMKAKYA